MRAAHIRDPLKRLAHPKQPFSFCHTGLRAGISSKVLLILNGLFGKGHLNPTTTGKEIPAQKHAGMTIFLQCGDDGYFKIRG
jgi:hypothetical protein